MIRRLAELIGRSGGWPIGLLALAAWIALLYFMFWDVL
jgi:hypothetical protein